MNSMRDMNSMSNRNSMTKNTKMSMSMNMNMDMDMNMNKPRKGGSESSKDSTAWLITGTVAEFLLANTYAIKYMVMVGYTYMHGSKLFPKFPTSSSLAYRFVAMILQCTWGGILVPIFINAIPVPLSMDAYPIAIMIAFLMHQYAPKLREILKLSSILKIWLIILYETMRAFVVVKFTAAAGKAIEPSDFEIAIFGPIFCGTIAGCGGAFMPLDKGLDPLMEGLAQPMVSALFGATFYHIFNATRLSKGVIDAPKKAHVIVAAFFIAHNIAYTMYVERKLDSKSKDAAKKNK